MKSLQLKGGPMSPAEMAEFERLPWSSEATKLRRFDEAAKDPHARTESFEYYLKYAEACGRHVAH